MSDTATPYRPPLLEENDPPPYEIINPDGKAPVLILADHAENRVPAKLMGAGFEGHLDKHYAVDIGAKTMALRIAERLDAPFIKPNYSRAVIDLNRRLRHTTMFPAQGEGAPIEPNIGITEEDVQTRLNELYYPYHSAIEQRVQQFLSGGIIPVVFSVHSFTRHFYNFRRPWDVGFLWTQDSRVTEALIPYFEGLGYNVGDNEPYDARFLSGATLHKHADDNRLPNTLIEICNDLIETEEKALQWGDIIYEGLNRVLLDKNIFTLYDGPVHIFNPALENHYFERLIQNARAGKGYR